MEIKANESCSNEYPERGDELALMSFQAEIKRGKTPGGRAGPEHNPLLARIMKWGRSPGTAHMARSFALLQKHTPERESGPSVLFFFFIIFSSIFSYLSSFELKSKPLSLPFLNFSTLALLLQKGGRLCTTVINHILKKNIGMHFGVCFIY